MSRLKRNLEKLTEENKKLNERNAEYTNIISLQREKIKWFEDFVNLEEQRFENRFGTILSTIFTPTQIQLLLHPKKTVPKWTTDNICSAISLRSISPKMYRF